MRCVTVLCASFQRLGLLEDLDQVDKAICIITEFTAATPADDRDRANRFYSLSICLYERYNQLGQIHDLDNAILASEKAVATTPIPDAVMLIMLGSQLTRRCERFGDSEDLEKAIMRINEALAETPLDSPVRPQPLLDSSNALFMRFDMQGKHEDLQAAIRVVEEALAMTPPNHPDWGLISLVLRDGYNNRYQRLGVPQDHINAMRAADMHLVLRGISGRFWSG